MVTAALFQTQRQRYRNDIIGYPLLCRDPYAVPSFRRVCSMTKRCERDDRQRRRDVGNASGVGPAQTSDDYALTEQAISRLAMLGRSEHYCSGVLPSRYVDLSGKIRVRQRWIPLRFKGTVCINIRRYVKICPREPGDRLR